ncbi:MAG: hypothetical protein R6U98_37235 [Pirellulaceae bacterium]
MGGRAPYQTYIFQAVGFFRVERCPTQAVLPLVGLANLVLILTPKFV